MFRIASTLFLALLLIGCSSMQGPDASTAEGAYALGEKYQKDERYEDAINEFTQVKNKHPYSKLATEAELRIADIHFEREDYIEAQNGYQSFKELHPSHPRIDYVTFQLGMSFFDQLPETIDRDLQLAKRAILYFDEVANSYPTSQYADKAREYKEKAIRMLAEKEEYIANFYLIRSYYLSALGRYEAILKDYPDQGLTSKALYGAAYCAYETKDFSKAKQYYDQLISDFPNTEDASKARSKLGNKL